MVDHPEASHGDEAAEDAHKDLEVEANAVGGALDLATELHHKAKDALVYHMARHSQAEELSHTARDARVYHMVHRVPGLVEAMDDQFPLPRVMAREEHSATVHNDEAGVQRDEHADVAAHPLVAGPFHRHLVEVETAAG